MPTQTFGPDAPGLYCVELRTGNWVDSVEWYRGILGLRVLVRVTDDGYALLAAGETRLALLAREKPGEPSPRISLAFEVPDLTAIATRLATAKYPFAAPKADAEGLRELNILDPDGNRLRLFSWPQNRG
jgi:catechol 2,3-dioxygenase-like lactoylglutathione lyase family enzyme